MNSEQITQIVRQTLFISMEIAAPFLILALIIGLAISFVQSITQIQEMTLSFVPKMIVIVAALGFFFPWMLKMLTKFTNNLLIYQWENVTSFIHCAQ